MFTTLAYRTLMHQKRWATNGLNAVLADAEDGLPDDDRVVVRRLLDHVQTVDDIFSHTLEGQPHGHRAPRSSELPSLETLARQARTTADWYVAYADTLDPDRVDETIAFTFTSGEPARMTRGEILLHVATHAAGHRGQVALLLQKNGMQPWPDRLTDFLAAAPARSPQEAPGAQGTP
ncbi:DinB family protein [Reyranella sp.]|uniref:DinB family protein n=1 Tax=Reyranella sp. TaxID=1929291 RepID=UPI003BAAFAA8